MPPEDRRGVADRAGDVPAAAAAERRCDDWRGSGCLSNLPALPALRAAPAWRDELGRHQRADGVAAGAWPPPTQERRIAAW